MREKRESSNGLSRREFLRRAAVVVPFVGAAPAVRRVFADERLRIAIVGSRGHGTKLARTFAARDDCVVVAICDPDREVASRLAARIEDQTGDRPPTVTDMRTLLDWGVVDGVAIATPHHWHAVAAVWALQAGKHVYLEKPMTHTLGEGEVILAAAKRYGRVVQVGSQRRSHPALRKAIAFLHGDGIGEVRGARCYSSKKRPSIGPAIAGEPPSSLDVNLWYGPRPVGSPGRERFHYDWHWFWAYGNGGLGNNGVHRLDVARWGLSVKGLGDAVLSYGGRFGPPDAGQTPNVQVSVHRFGDRAIVHELRGLPSKPAPGLGRKDEVVFEGDGADLICTASSARVVEHGSRAVVKRFEATGSALARHAGNFVRAVRDGEGIRVSPREGHWSAGLCHAAAISHRLGSTMDDEAIAGVLPSLALPDSALSGIDRARFCVRDAGAKESFVLGPMLAIDGERFTDPAAEALRFETYRPPFVLPAPDRV